MDLKHVCTIYIKSTPETVWQGLTDAAFTSQYFHSTSIESTWQKGSEVTYRNQDGSIAVAGEVITADHPRELSFTWHVHYNEQAKKERPSRVTFLLEPVEDSTKLTLIHDDFDEGTVVLPNVSEGWIAILSNLKTLIETDEVMAVS